jgi:hypothetical protein
MVGKSTLDGAFETSGDTIRNSVSFPYRWEFVSSIAPVAAILEHVVDLVGCIRQLLVQPQEILLVVKLLISLADERAHGDSELMDNFLPKRVGA